MVNSVTDSPEGVLPKDLDEMGAMGLFEFCEKLRKEKRMKAISKPKRLIFFMFDRS
jgi:hypothetical protein